MTKPAILIAGGGTGGHVFPGLAVARALTDLADVEVVFAGTDRGLEARVVPEHGYRLERLEVEPMKGGGAARAVRGGLVAAKAMGRASALVRSLRPRVALSVGGYAAGPVALAAVMQRVPLAILEPNAPLGLANRWLSRFARRAYVAWGETAAKFRQGTARRFGVPLRAGFSPRPYAPRAGERRLLVLGGSQGAEALNARLPSAVARAAEKVGAISVVHQTGRGRDAVVREAYARARVEAAVLPFLDDVAERMAEADVIVARAGAVTVAEIAAVGRAAVLVPFPHAADDHQTKNADALASLGGAIRVRQEAADEVRLGAELALLFEDDERRRAMAEAARAHGRPDAATEIAHDLLGLAALSSPGMVA